MRTSEIKVHAKGMPATGVDICCKKMYKLNNWLQLKLNNWLQVNGIANRLTGALVAWTKTMGTAGTLIEVVGISP